MYSMYDTNESLRCSYVDIKESHKLYVCIEISDENVMDMLSS